MTKQNLILIAACLTAGLLLGGEVKAQSIKDVNVVNEPNVNVLNNVGATVTNDTANPVPVVVQNGTTSAPVKELVEITAQTTDTTPTVVYTVPTLKRLTITDVIITGAQGFVGIQRNNVTISKIPLPGTFSVYQQSYVSGIQFNAGDTVGVFGTALSQGTFFELRGYLMDNN